MRAVVRETERKLIGGCFSCRVTQEGELRTGAGGGKEGKHGEENGSSSYYSKKHKQYVIFLRHAVHRRNAVDSRLSVCLRGRTDPWGFHWKNEEV